MFNSIRVRLTIWYTGVLALVLILFAVTAYFFVSRAIAERADRTLDELADSFQNTINIESRENEQENTGESSPDAEIFQETRENLSFKDYDFFVFDGQQNLVLAGKHFDAKNLPKRPVDFHNKSFLTISGGSNKLRLTARRLNWSGRDYLLVAAHSLAEESGLQSEIQFVFALAIPTALLMTSLGGYFLARKALSPVVSMSRQAAFITAQNLHERLPVGNERDELGSLAQAVNDLLARLDDSFAAQRRFMADASHELRTPIAIVRGESEIALSKNGRTAEDYRESLEIVFDESRRMSRIVEDLMTLARVDAGRLPLQKNELQFDRLLTDCVRVVRVLAEQKQIEIKKLIKNDVLLCGDTELLHRMLINLLDNAVKYAERGSKIKITAERDDGFYIINVENTGNRIPDEDQSLVFERFFRADNARSRAETVGGSGVGLGLPIARWIAEAHDGTLKLVKSDEKGTIFAISLPCKR